MKEIKAFGHEENEERECLYFNKDYIVHTCGRYLTVYDRKEYEKKGRYTLKWKDGQDFKEYVTSICQGCSPNSVVFCGASGFIGEFDLSMGE